MARSDPPGGNPGVMSAIDAPKAGGKNGRMAPPGASNGGAGGAKASPEEAIVIRADSHCIDCSNYSPQDGSCEKVDGSFDPQDACSKFFSALNDQEPDADDRMSGDSGQDSDADDQGGGQ